jgi:hypothetical protein
MGIHPFIIHINLGEVLKITLEVESGSSQEEEEEENSDEFLTQWKQELKMLEDCLNNPKLEKDY